MRTPALLSSLFGAALLAACSLTASPPPPPPTTSGSQWGQPVDAAASAAAPTPLRVQREPALQCVPEGGDCGPAEAQCCAGYTCAGLNRSICITKH
jgi:hypothetical protein